MQHISTSIKFASVKIGISVALFIVSLSYATASHAQKAKTVNVDKKGLALKGYDPVAYFKDHKAVKGNAKYKLRHGAAVWYFASDEHRQAFKSNPGKYKPRYGGYCAWAMSQGKLADIDPKAWKIHAGKLYLNYNKAIQRKWEKNMKAFIRDADEKWPKVQAGKE